MNVLTVVKELVGITDVRQLVRDYKAANELAINLKDDPSGYEAAQEELRLRGLLAKEVGLYRHFTDGGEHVDYIVDAFDMTGKPTQVRGRIGGLNHEGTLNRVKILGNIGMDVYGKGYNQPTMVQDPIFRPGGGDSIVMTGRDSLDTHLQNPYVQLFGDDQPYILLFETREKDRNVRLFVPPNGGVIGVRSIHPYTGTSE